MTTQRGGGAVATRRRLHWLGAGVLVVGLVVVVAVEFGRTDPPRSLAYTGTGEAQLTDLNLCVSIALRATITAQRSNSAVSVRGWHSAQVVVPAVAAQVTDCQTRRPRSVDQLQLVQQWRDRECRLRGVASPLLKAELGARTSDVGQFDGEPDDRDGWQLRTDLIDCRKPTIVGTASGSDTDALAFDSDGYLAFSGRSWAKRLCLDPRVHITVVEGSLSTGTTVALPLGCLEPSA